MQVNEFPQMVAVQSNGAITIVPSNLQHFVQFNNPQLQQNTQQQQQKNTQQLNVAQLNQHQLNNQQNNNNQLNSNILTAVANTLFNQSKTSTILQTEEKPKFISSQLKVSVPSQNNINLINNVNETTTVTNNNPGNRHSLRVYIPNSRGIITTTSNSLNSSNATTNNNSEVNL